MATISAEQRLKAFAPLIVDVVAPFALYYILRAFGAGEIAAFSVAGAVTGIVAVVESLRKRKLDTLKLLVFFELAVSLGLAIAIDDPRIAAIRPSIYLLVAGVYFLFSTVVGRPILYIMATPMATNAGEPVRTRAYEWAWLNSTYFRRRQRMMTGSVGLVMFLDAIVRVFIVFAYPASQVDKSFLLSNGAGVVMIVLVVALLVYFVRGHSSYLDGVVEDMKAKDAVPAQG